MVAVLSELRTDASPYAASSSWFGSSFDADPWATASELLSCRDELLTGRIAAGWPDRPADGGVAESGAASGGALPNRLAALTSLADNPNIPGGGFPDRIIDLLEALGCPEFCALSPLAGYRIFVEEPEDLLPPVWRAVFQALPAAGGVVEYRAESGAASGASAAELTVVRAADEWQAAEQLSAVLAQLADVDSAHAQRAALVVPGDSSALDCVLERWGLPVTGRGRESAARWGLQILPAFLATLWSPADPHAIASFLSLATGLVPAVVSRTLMDALSTHPGTGGATWAKALEKIAKATDEETSQMYDRYFSCELFSPEEGVPAGVLADRLVWLNQRLAARIQQRETVGSAMGHIAELRDVLERLSTGGRSRIPRSLLDRILSTVVRPVSGGRTEQAAAWTVHGSPATVSPDSLMVFYWNCIDSEPARSRRFTEAEHEVLAAAGYLLEPPERIRSRTEWNLLRIVSQPERHIVACVPEQIRGTAVGPAAWLGELTASGEPTIDIAGASVERVEPSVVALPDPDPVFQVLSDSVDCPETLSYSAMQSLLGCPAKWALGRIRELSPASNVALPTGNQMIGTLTHAIVEYIAREHAIGGNLPENCGEIARARFDEMVPAMAAELLQPGRGLDRRRYRETVVSAVTGLREAIDRLQLTITRVETLLEAPLELSVGSDGTTIRVMFRGFADMELADGQSNSFVLDLKFSYAKNYYTDLVSRGEALQLASYAWLIEAATGTKTIGSGYFLLPGQVLRTDSPRAGEAAVESARPLSEVWRRGTISASRALQRLRVDGIVDVTGLQEQVDDDAAEARRRAIEDAGGLYVEPPCRFCDYQIICGYGRGRT